MNDQPKLSEAEWTLISQLLDQELDELPTEIHHCRNQKMKHDLQERQEMVRQLRDRIRGLATV
ncbi:MAG: hypothetical protein ABFD16_16355 [Thermoguttaceae bacterium]|jgi:hypothetical protein